ncbi:hypothetical protein J421_2496 [Gemmatirosa kalamazoonensis]|uniref:Soluble ligand binding domain-containing protein n=1 Tax=Gemmatirosa kalamazoonensis TaxID=861299 RepID=W0RKS2_9BACT|nr:hypothetical protein J421_2496 [Gemmatirosa kalamazoonensis]
MHVAVLLGTVAAVAAGAQTGRQSGPMSLAYATRAQITHRLDSLVQVDQQGLGKPKDKKARAAEIARLRSRLTDGDFQTGDRFLVDFGAPGQRPDTVIVLDSVKIAMVNWPATSLHGVLRSELQGAVEKYVAAFVREPRIRVYPLTRLQFVGGFGRPGVYAVDPTRPLSDALMVAGGTQNSSKPDKVTIHRGDDEIMSQKSVEQAIAEGATVQDLGLESGDQIEVPRPRQVNSFGRGRLQTILFSVSIVTAVLAFVRASYAGQ